MSISCKHQPIENICNYSNVRQSSLQDKMRYQRYKKHFLVINDLPGRYHNSKCVCTKLICFKICTQFNRYKSGNRHIYTQCEILTYFSQQLICISLVIGGSELVLCSSQVFVVIQETDSSYISHVFPLECCLFLLICKPSF